MKENFWKNPSKTESKPNELSFHQKLENLKTTIRNSSSKYDAKDVHKLFVVLFKEAKIDVHKKILCESAIDYCNEKWINSSNTNLFSKYSDLSKVVGQIRAYWKSEKKQLDIPIRPFAPKNNSQ